MADWGQDILELFIENTRAGPTFEGLGAISNGLGSNPDGLGPKFKGLGPNCAGLGPNRIGLGPNRMGLGSDGLGPDGLGPDCATVAVESVHINKTKSLSMCTIINMTLKDTL